MNKTMLELLAKERTAGKVLHGLMGYDFCKPYTILFHKGNFTVNSIYKMIDNERYNTVITLIMSDPESRYGWRKGTQHIVTLESGKVNIEWRAWRGASKHGKMDNFLSKGDFESMRKSKTAETYIICQSNDYILSKNDHPVDLANRFKMKNVEQYRDKDSNLYISRLNLVRMDDTGSAYTYNAPTYHYNRAHKSNDIQDFIDKSGYIVYDKRADLKRKADALRAERAKAAFVATDNAEKVINLKSRIIKAKNDLAASLIKADNSEEVKEIADKLWKYRGMSGIMSDFERLEKGEKEKSFRSIDDFASALNDIAESLSSLIGETVTA